MDHQTRCIILSEMSKRYDCHCHLISFVAAQAHWMQIVCIEEDMFDKREFLLLFICGVHKFLCLHLFVCVRVHFGSCRSWWLQIEAGLFFSAGFVRCIVFEELCTTPTAFMSHSFTFPTTHTAMGNKQNPYEKVLWPQNFNLQFEVWRTH